MFTVTPTPNRLSSAAAQARMEFNNSLMALASTIRSFQTSLIVNRRRNQKKMNELTRECLKFRKKLLDSEHFEKLHLLFLHLTKKTTSTAASL
ncbi:MAG: hypothetical protein ACOYK9_05785 [Chlamydiia bacterium]